MKPIIKAENVSKRYRIGGPEKSYDTFGAYLYGFFTSPIQNFKAIKNLSSFNNENDATLFWALRDVNFEILPGEVVGIVGHNGAGKSTLLKILSRITEPTTGNIVLRGRVSSLLEVGTGFHPDLTGRDNIYMNGTLLGMTKREISSKFDEIVEFSGVSKYIDTPVKRYSSGMTVRLAFSVAAHLEPEILIIDEVLAVGDSEFQKKCLGKMREVSGHGRTVLFVSHNLAAVKSLCNRALLLKKGRLELNGNVDNIVSSYLATNSANIQVGQTYENEIIKLNDIIISNEFPFISQSFSITIDFILKISNINLDVTIGLIDTYQNEIFYTRAIVCDKHEQSKDGKYHVAFNIPGNLLNSGGYSIRVIFGKDQYHSVMTLEELKRFEVQNESYGNNHEKYPGLIRPLIRSTVKKITHDNEAISH